MNHPSEFDHRRFARAYLGAWGDPKITAQLPGMYRDGFDYAENVDLSAKGLLMHMDTVAQVMSNEFEVRFANIGAKSNSESSRAVQDYVKVFLCERGYAASFEAAGKKIDALTEFHGLLKDGEKAYARRAHKDPYKDQRAIYLTAKVDAARMADLHAALDALQEEVAILQEQARSKISPPALNGNHAKKWLGDGDDPGFIPPDPKLRRR